MGIKTNKTIIVTGTTSLSSRFVTINIPHKVKQINIRSMCNHDNTTAYPRAQMSLHSSLINGDCVGFFPTTGTPFQYLNGGSYIRYIYNEPITIQGQYEFFMRNLQGAFVQFIGTATVFFIQLEFCSECDEY